MLRGDAQKVPALVLWPMHDLTAPKLSVYIDKLRTLGLLGRPWRDGRYEIGTEFLDLVSFLGCAPSLQLAPLEDSHDLRFCHIHPVIAPECQRFSVSTLAPAPRCSDCGNQHSKWKNHLPFHTDDTLACTACGASAPAPEWVWRNRTYCLSDLQIRIMNIYDSEAIPAQQLIDCLNEVDDGNWNYCYITP